jgi:3-hydroxyisobutyrate dehydrogenase-like beta-hydroxyacid dehydrogenase
MAAATLTVGVFSPGAMGSALGRAWGDGGARVVTTVAGRSERTRMLAEGLEILPRLGDVVEQADLVASVGPPGDALRMASEIVEACVARDRQPLVADLNAIAPTTALRIGERVRAAGCDFVDGSISGGPPSPSTATRLYLCGPSAKRIACLPAPGLVPRVLGPEIGVASAVKMCTASVYKGFTALLLQALHTARVHGVTDIVVADMERTFGALMTDVAARIAEAASKSDRYPAELREVALTQREAGVESVLAQAVAQVYETVAGTALAALSPERAECVTDLDDALAALATRVG